MICQKCKRDFLNESDIEESHDVPCYLFEGYGRKEKKQKADKYPRHWLCNECHKEYEEQLKLHFKVCALEFANKFFGVKDE